MLRQKLNSIGVRVGLGIAATLIILQSVSLYLATQDERQLKIESEVNGARNLILMAESVRENMERKWELGLFSPESIKAIEASSAAEKKTKILATVPVVSAWESAKAKAKEGGFEFRTPREGARNPNNNPDAVESEVLDYFRNNPNATERYVIDEGMNAIRYFRPVRLGAVCMNCHGDPATAKAIWGTDDGYDITGFKMDGKKVGDLHGAFEVIRSLAAADAKTQQAINVGIAETIIGLVIAMGVIWWTISKLVSRPVNLALNTITRAEETNDLTLKLDESVKGEVGDLAKAFNCFTSRLRGFMGDIVGASGQLAGAAEQLNDITHSTADAVQAQQGETQQVATAMEEMTATVAEVAQSAEAAAQAANAATEETQRGEKVVSSSRDNISRLANDTRGTSDIIKQLEKDSDAIGSILDVIRGIAEQTNLLALNAAIEAARAGEQGRGFAVVADEVRTLAQRTQKSTAEIQEMIEKLQSGAKNAVGAMGRGTDQALESVAQAEKASEALAAIANAINTIDGMNTQIATASVEQSSVAEEVNRNISNIHQASHQTADSTVELGNASNELKDLATQLQTLVGTYKV